MKTHGILVDVGDAGQFEMEQYTSRQMDAWCGSNLQRMVFDSAAVVDGAVARDELRVRGGGVYFMVLDSQVVYVGQSNNIGDRIYQHERTGLRFDSACAIAGVPSRLRDCVEYAYIAAWRPPGNGKRIHGYGCRGSDGFGEMIAATDASRVARPPLRVIAAAGY